jgi:uncharacterized protein (TIGR02145 family)
LCLLTMGFMACSDHGMDAPDERWPDAQAALSSSRTGTSSSSATKVSYGEFKDSRDNQTYRTVTIGPQTWMAENLNVGSMVLGSVDQSDAVVIEKYCYDDDAAACATDGGLYQWAEAMDLASTCNSTSCIAQISSGHHQGLCPTGWHIPKPAEWDVLATYLGGADAAGKTMKLNNTGYTDWDASMYNNGNSSGFSALPAGGRVDGFDSRGLGVGFWEASEYVASSASYRVLYYGRADFYAANNDKAYGLSVRCLRDDISLPTSSSSAVVVPSSSSAVASGGNTQTCTYSSTNNTLACTEQTYQTVTIGTQTWMAENLNVGAMVLGTASTADQSNNAVIEKYCYDDNAANCTTDGGLYQWAEAMALPSTCNSTSCAAQISSGHHQGICPTGWHMPKAAEWDALATYLGGASVAGAKMKLNNTSYTSWNASTYNNGNSSGFSALPAGARDYSGGFRSRGSYVLFWEASESEASGADDRYLDYRSAVSFALSSDKSDGFSVRCLRDE